MKSGSQTAAEALKWLQSRSAQQLRLAWCDLHGHWHAKSMLPAAFESALSDGIRIAGTLMLKDRSGRTALPVFDADAMQALGPELAAFAEAGDVLLTPDFSSLTLLPWAPHTAWMRCDVRGQAAALCPREALLRQLEKATARGYTYRCGLEIEFHVYRMPAAHTDPALAQWPGCPPSALSLLHPGYQLLSEPYADACEPVFAVLRELCAGLDLPLRSLEIEMGPSQFEAVFDVQDALAAADTLALFRSAVRQALARSGYHATFCCRPPFERIMSSGWHLHQSFTDGQDHNLFAPSSAGEPLSATGMHALAGLLAHTQALAAIAAPSINAYERYQPKQLAPTAVSWGVDSRSALLRVVGSGQAARIENRLGEPSANPYLTMATQLAAMLDGVEQRLQAPAPASATSALPSGLAAALDAFEASTLMRSALGAPLQNLVSHVQRQSLTRFEAAADKPKWLANEYFA